MACETRCNLAVEAARHDLYCVGLIDAFQGDGACTGPGPKEVPAIRRGADCVDIVHWGDDECAAGTTPLSDDGPSASGSAAEVGDEDETEPAIEHTFTTYQPLPGIPLSYGAHGADVMGAALLDVMA